MASDQPGDHVASVWVAEHQPTVTRREFVSQAYAENRDRIYRYLVALGVDPSRAEDLTQELFMKLYATIGKGTQIQNVRAWTFTVASNLALNHLRAEASQRLLSDGGAESWLELQVQPGPDPEGVLMERERAIALWKAVDALSPQQRVCVHLRAEGFRYREIARILGVTVPTVAQFLHRAISHLKRAGI